MLRRRCVYWCGLCVAFFVFFSAVVVVDVVESCVPNRGCISNRECSFGDGPGGAALYLSVATHLRRLTGYSASCSDCGGGCERNPDNEVSRLLLAAASDPGLYGNNSVCSDSYVVAGLGYVTGGFECETTFRASQVPLYALCGQQNSVSCSGECGDCRSCLYTYQVDVGRPLCRIDRSGTLSTQTYVETILVFVSTLIIFLR